MPRPPPLCASPLARTARRARIGEKHQEPGYQRAHAATAAALDALRAAGDKCRANPAPRVPAAEWRSCSLVQARSVFKGMETAVRRCKIQRRRCSYGRDQVAPQVPSKLGVETFVCTNPARPGDVVVGAKAQRVAALRRDARACGGAADDAFGTFVVEEACAQG